MGIVELREAKAAQVATRDTQAYASAVAKRIGGRTTDPIDIKDPAKLKGMQQECIGGDQCAASAFNIDQELGL